MIPMAAFHVLDDSAATASSTTTLTFNFGNTGMVPVEGLASFRTLSEVITAKSTLECIARPPPDRDPLLTEAFLLKCGARSHFDYCQNRYWWLGLGDAPRECCVCMEDLLSIESVYLPCQHAFHQTCAERWAKSCEEEPTCPVCRRLFHVSEMVRITPHPVRQAEDVLQSSLMELGRGGGGEAHALKLAALRRYAEDPFSSDVLRSMEVITAQGPKRIDQTLLMQTFRPVGTISLSCPFYRSPSRSPNMRE
jgi:hypothetical protein